MTGIPFFQVDAFAESPLSGNPAAVLPLDRWLPDDLMQAIAAENNLSETAFTVPSERDDADFHLRWFTPTTEVALCGHATIAAGHVVMSGHHVRFATKSGILSVARDEDGLLRLNLPAHSVEPGECPGLLDALRLEDGETFMAQGAERAAIVLLQDEQAVRAVSPDFVALRDFPELVIVTAPGNEYEIASRVFAVPVGIDEDPVTGAAHAALVPFWAERLGRNEFIAIQASARTGILHCQLEGDRVVLGGHCVTVIAGTFQI